jgi:hypothetical protein
LRAGELADVAAADGLELIRIGAASAGVHDVEEAITATRHAKIRTDCAWRPPDSDSRVPGEILDPLAESRAPVRLRITHGCVVRGVSCAEGAIVEVDDEATHDLLNLGYAEAADEATARRFRHRPRYGWVDSDQDAKPKPGVRVVQDA